MDLGASVPCGVPVGQARDRLYGGEGTRRPVQSISGDTAALLIGKVGDVLGGMKAIVTGTEAFRWLNPQRRIGGQTAALGVEFELENHIGAVVLAQRLQDIVAEASNMRHEGKPVRAIGLDSMGAGGRIQPVEGWSAHRSVRAERVDRGIPALVVCGEQNLPVRSVARNVGACS